MKNLFLILAIILTSAVAAAAQADLKRNSGGRTAGQSNYTAPRRGGANSLRSATYRRGGRNSLMTGVLRLGPRTTYLSEGLTAWEVERFLGQPSSVSERREGTRTITTRVFPRGEGHVLVAEFVDDVLVGSRLETFKNLAQAGSAGN